MYSYASSNLEQKREYETKMEAKMFLNAEIKAKEEVSSKVFMLMFEENNELTTNPFIPLECYK